MDGKSFTQKLLALPLCLSVAWCGGCFAKKRPAYHFSDVALARPVVPQPMTEAAAMEPPDIPFDIASPPERLGPPRNPPPRPRVALAPAPGPAPVEKAAEPIISPELSEEQLAAAKIETQRSLIVAERNLGLSQGRQLNSTQQDIASKIRGFMEASRDAMKNGDWPRARSQAKKAEVLSQELAASF